MKQLFQGLAWYNRSEYLLMVLMTVSIAIDWHLSIWVLSLLFINTMVKAAATRKLGNPMLIRASRISLLLIMAFYALYAISSTYSCNPSEAWSTTLITMLPMILLPLIFLCSDMQYLKQRHFDTLVFLLSGTLTIRFFVMLIRAVFGYFHGTELNMLIDFHFDPLHHNYLALYLLSAIALQYVLLLRHWNQKTWCQRRWWMIADMLLLTLYMVIMGSRSSLVILALIVAACIIHLAFVRRRWLATGLLIGMLTLTIGASYLAMPRLYWRILYSANLMLQGKQGDGRQTIWACGLEVLQGHEVIGLGCDGYWDQLHQSYVDHNFAEGFLKEQYNTHNQYLETTLCTGLIGLALLLAIILLPAILSFRKPRNFPMLLFTIAYAGSLFFEVTLARQMGILFVFWWYCLLQIRPQRS